MTPSTVAEVVATLEETEPETVDLYGTLAPVYEHVLESVGIPESQFGTVAATLPADTDAVVEYACGMGGLLARLAEQYDAVVGLDRSRSQLSLARAKTDAELVRGDVRTPVFGERFDAAVMLGHSVGHLTDEDDVARCLDAVAGSLRPGGLFFFDCHSLSAHAEPDAEQNVADGDRFRVVHESDLRAADADGIVERSDAFTITDREADRTVTAETGTYSFRAHDLESMAALLTDAGFEVLDARPRDGGSYFLARCQ